KHFYGPVMCILFILNGVLFVGLFYLAPSITSWIGDEQLRQTFKLAAFLFLFIPVVSFFRGVSQGYEQMKPTAFSQIAEQLIRVIIIIGAAYFVYQGSLQLYEIGT